MKNIDFFFFNCWLFGSKIAGSTNKNSNTILEMEMDENIGQIVMIVLIVSAVGIFVGSRIWMLFRK